MNGDNFSENVCGHFKKKRVLETSEFKEFGELKVRRVQQPLNNHLL